MGGTMAGHDSFSKNLISFHGTDPFAGTYTSCLAGHVCVNRKTTGAAILKDSRAGDFRPIAGSAADGYGALLVSHAGCDENWACSPWSNYCGPDNLRLRSCQDLNKCRTADKRPALTESCSGASTDPNSAVSGGCGSMEGGADAFAPILLLASGLALSVLRRRPGDLGACDRSM